MSNGLCVSLTPEIEENVSKLVDEFVTPSTKKTAKVQKMVTHYIAEGKPIDADELKKRLNEYFRDIVKRYCYNESDGTITVPTMQELKKHISNDFDEKEKQAAEEARLKDEALAASINEETLHQSVEFSGSDLRKASAYVETMLRTQLNKAGIKFSSVHNALLQAFKHVKGNCTVEDLYNILYVACTLSDGKPVTNAATLRKAMAGDKNSLNDIRSAVERMENSTSGRVRALEKRAMNIALDIYMNKHPEMIGKVNDIQVKIKAMMNASRKQKAMALAFADVQNRINSDSFDVTNDSTSSPNGSNMGFRTNRRTLEAIERILNNTVRERGIKRDYESNKLDEPFAGLADYLEREIGDRLLGSPLGFVDVLKTLLDAYKDGRIVIKRGYGGTSNTIDSIQVEFVTKEKKGDTEEEKHILRNLAELIGTNSALSAVEKDDEGEYVDGLYKDDVRAILDACFRQAFKTGTASANKLREYLTQFKGSELNTNSEDDLLGHRMPYADEVLEVLNELRDEWAGEEQEFMEQYGERAASDSIVVDKQATEMEKRSKKKLITAYGARTLKDRVDAVTKGIIKSAKESRFKLIKKLTKHVQDIDGMIVDDLDSIKEIRGERADVELSEDEKQQIAGIKDHLDLLRSQKRERLRSIAMLQDKGTAFREALKVNLTLHTKDAILAMINTAKKNAQLHPELAEQMKEEVRLLKLYEHDLLSLAFSQLEAITGAHVVMQITEDGIKYEVEANSDDAEHNPDSSADVNEETGEGDINDNDEEGTNDTSTNGMDYDANEDPYAHLSQNVRAFLSMLEVKDSAGNKQVDDLGIVKVHEPRSIYTAILSMCDGEIDTVEDFYTLKPNSELNDTDHTYPPLYDENGAQNGPMRTEKEAFPHGKPEFPLLDKFENKYPWITELKERLINDFMVMSTVEDNNSEANVGVSLTDLYCELGHTFVKRVMIKDNMMIDTNTLAEVDSNRRSQQQNYDNRIMNTNKMIYNSSGTVNVKNCEDLYKIINKFPKLDEIREGLLSLEKVKKASKDLENVLAAMGFDIEPGLIYNELAQTGNLTGYTKIAAIVEAAGSLLHALSTTDKTESDPDNNIYNDNWSRWQYMWNAVGFVLNKDSYTTSTTENGKQRYNWLQPNELHKLLNMVSLGHRAARYAYGKDREKLLAKRRERIDRMYRDCPDFIDPETGEYSNHILKEMYEGLDLPTQKESEVVRTGLRKICDSVQMSLKDDKDYSKLSEEDRWTIQFAGYMRGNMASNAGSRLFAFPVMADAPVIQFISGLSITAKHKNYDAINGAIIEMTKYTMIDLRRIQRHRRQKAIYAAVQAYKNGWISGKKYYDITENEADVPIPTGNTQEAIIWKKVGLVHKIINGTATKANINELNMLLDPGETVEGLKQDYINYSGQQFRNTYFTSEMMFGWLRPLNSTLMTLDEIIDRLDHYGKAEVALTEDDVYGGMVYGRKELVKAAGNRKFTLEGAIDFMMQNRDKIKDAPDIEADMAYVFTAKAMEEQYNRETRSLVEPRHLHRELEHLHCAEMALREQPDYKGDVWELEEVNTLVEGKEQWRLVNKTTGRTEDLTEAENRYVRSRIRNMRAMAETPAFTSAVDYFRKNSNMFTFKGEKTYNATTILKFRPRWKNHDELMAIAKKMSGNAKTAKVDEQKVYHACREMWYDGFVHNTALLQMFGMDPSQFKSDEELTKRLKMMYSNGLRADTNRITAYKEEHYIIASDDERAISKSYADTVMVFARSNVPTQEAKQKCLAHAEINATNAQGLLTLSAYRAKASAYGSSYWNATHERLYQDLISGKRSWSDREVKTAFQTLKQIGMGISRDTDPNGYISLLPQGIKNSEAPMMTDYGMPRSATMIALDQSLNELKPTHVRVDENGKKHVDTWDIHSVQRPSGVKTARKGIVDVRYLPERVNALKKLCQDVAGKSAEEQTKIFEKFAKEWADEFLELDKTVIDDEGNRSQQKQTLDADIVRAFAGFIIASTSDSLAEKMGNLKNASDRVLRAVDMLTFDRVDDFIHTRLAEITEKVLDHNMSEKDFREEVNKLISLRNFMMPVKSTERTINGLKEQIKSSVMNEDGSVNEQFVRTIDCRSQAMQLRISHHEKNTLGSQQAYLTPTGIKPDQKYKVKINNGKAKAVFGDELYDKFNQCLAARLLKGAQKVNKRIHNLYDLRNWLVNIMDNNPKYQDIVQGLAIVERAIGDQTIKTFSTPISSVATVYRLSEIITSLSRNNTHRKPVKGRAEVIEADEMYDDNLGIAYNPDGSPAGVECYITADNDIVQHCLVKHKRTLMVNGEPKEVEVEEVDIDKLIKAGLGDAIGYRIPTEELHSMLPLIVKKILPPSRGASIIVAKEITTLTGGDNDVDKLFLMIRNLELVGRGRNKKLRPVQYDWNESPLEQSEEAIENMMIDITNAVLTDPTNTTRWLAPQNPDTYVQVGNEIAYSKLPAEMKLREVTMPEGIDYKGKHYDYGDIVYIPDYEHWDETDFSKGNKQKGVKGYDYFAVVHSPKNIDPAKLAKHMQRMHVNPVQSVGSGAYFHKQHNLAKIGVATGADNMAGYAKIRSGLDQLKGGKKIEIKTEGRKCLSSGLSINGVHIDEYCPEFDTAGHSVMENCSDFSAAMVDSGKSSAISDIGINLNNAGFAGALLSRFGIDPRSMSFIMAILNKYPNFIPRYRHILNQIIENPSIPIDENTNLGDITTEDLESAFNEFDLLSKETLTGNPELLRVCHVIDFLYSTYNNTNLRLYERTLKFNSAKHGMSNDFASAVWSVLMVEKAEKAINDDKLPITIQPEMVIRTRLKDEDLINGVITLDDGKRIAIGLPQVQMYFTCGIERGLVAMGDKIFYAHPAFMELARSFAPLLDTLSKEEGIKFLKQLHDEFNTYYLSDMSIVTHRGGSAALQGFNAMRDYYRYQFPNEFRTRLSNPDLRKKYEIMRVLKVEDGKLQINDDLKNELTVIQIRNSLTKMAESDNIMEKEMALDLFLYSYFSDGLRFGYGSVSNVFDVGFLGNDIFKEYNEKIELMCRDQNLAGKKLARFALQFVRNNYKKYNLGTMIYASKAAQKNDEGMWEVIDEANAEPEEYEVTPQEIARLEAWLADKENNNKMYLDDSDRMRGESKVVRLKFPSVIASKLQEYDFKNGEFVQIQSSFSGYERNLYMIGVDQRGRYLQKVNDTSGDKWYDLNKTILEMAEMDCWRNERGGTGKWHKGKLVGRPAQKAEARKAFMENKISPDMERANQKKADEGEELSQLQGPDVDSEVDEALNQIAARRDDGADSMDFDFLFGDDAAPSMADAFADVIETQEKKKRFPAKKGESPVRVSTTHFSTLASYKEEEEETNEQSQDQEKSVPMFMVAFQQPTETTQQRKDATARRFGVHNVRYTNINDAISAAATVNEGQTEFIAVAKQSGGEYVVTLYVSSNRDAAQQWSDQYKTSMLTGDQGIDSKMTGFGDQTVRFTERVDNLTSEECERMAKDLVKLLEATMSRKHAGEPIEIPELGLKTAEAIIRKLSNEKGMDTLFKDIAANMTPELATQLFGNNEISAVNYKDAAPEDMMRLCGLVLSNLNHYVEKLNNIARDNQGTDVAKKATYMAGKFSRILPTLVASACSRTSIHAADGLRNLIGMSVPGQQGVSAEQQQAAAQTRVVFNNGLRKIDSLKELAEKALTMELRKERIYHEQQIDTTKTKERIDVLQRALKARNGVGPGMIMAYLYHIAQEYKDNQGFLDALSTGSSDLGYSDKLDRLYKIRMILKSHEEILEQLNDLVNSSAYMDEFALAYNYSAGGATGEHITASTRQMFDEVKKLHISMKKQFTENAAPTVIGFFKEFIGNADELLYVNGKRITWQQLFESYDGDISFVDQYLRSMGDTNDPVGMMVARVVRNQHDRARDMAIDDQQGKIKDLNQYILEHGLTDFEFMFERDADGKKTGWYVSWLNNGAFRKALEEQRKKLKEVLDDTSKTAEERQAAREEFKAWTDRYANETHVGTYEPKVIVNDNGVRTSPWKNEAWDNLTDTQREFIEKFMKIKEEYDKRLGAHTANARAIQRRMTSEQRFRANFTLSPTAFFNNVKEKLANDFLVREDDYMEQNERSTILGFDGSERMIVPAPYVRMLKNPEELSTDPIGCLVAYSYATANFEMMKEIANPLELVFDALVDGRVQWDEKNGRVKTETFRGGVKEKAKIQESRFLKKLRSFLDSQIYMRYMSDGDDTFKIWGKEFRKSKVINAFLHMSAVAQLGFNWLVDIANLSNGLLQTNIEAAARRYFSGTALRKADAIYGRELVKFIPDLTRPIKESKLALMSEKFNFLQNFDVKVYNNRRNSVVAKFFNNQVAFLGTACGNHWLYSRAAIARMLSIEVTYPDGTKSNLWDAFSVKPDEATGKNKLQLKEGAMIDGKPITENDLHKLTDEIANINRHLFGAYSREDLVMAQKTCMGKLLISFRKHIVPLMDKRWRKRHKNEFGEWEEGYMWTIIPFMKALRDAQFKIPAAWEAMDEEQRQYLRMAFTDIAQMAALWLIGMLLLGGDDDDEDETELKKWCKFIIAREKHEMGSMLPTLYMPKEAWNIIDQPVMGTQQLGDLYNFCDLAFHPMQWTDKVKAGPFAGQTQLEMRFRKLPFPPMTYIKNIDKSIDGVDNSTWFYGRGYVGGGRGK